MEDAQRTLAKRLSLAQVRCPLLRLERRMAGDGALPLAHPESFLLALVESGRLRCGRLRLAAGDSLLAAPGDTTVHGAPTARLVMLRPELLLAGALDPLAGLRLPARLPPDDEGLSAAVWAELLATQRRLHAGDHWMRVRGRGLVLSLLGLLLRNGFAAGSVSQDLDGQPPWLRTVVELAQRRLGDRRLRVGDLAAAARLSPSHFAHRFTALVGVAPLAWLRGLRLRRACALLCDQPELGVKAVAAASGFGDVCHFTRRFRRQTGCPPGAWRRRHPPTPTEPLPGG
jgi:AraC-like DNA-binding protein